MSWSRLTECEPRSLPSGPQRSRLPESCNIATELASRGLTVDVLVNNAGLSTTGPVHRSSPEREIAMIRTDVEAVVHLCNLFLPGMVDRGRGAVLNVASTAAFNLYRCSPAIAMEGDILGCDIAFPFIDCLYIF